MGSNTPQVTGTARAARVAHSAGPEPVLDQRWTTEPGRQALNHLMQRAGQVCRRADLLADVWGYTFATSSNVLDVYIRRLRTKLDPDCIETVRNAGYCFTAD